MVGGGSGDTTPTTKETSDPLAAFDHSNPPATIPPLNETSGLSAAAGVYT